MNRGVHSFRHFGLIVEVWWNWLEDLPREHCPVKNCQVHLTLLFYLLNNFKATGFLNFFKLSQLFTVQHFGWIWVNSMNFTAAWYNKIGFKISKFIYANIMTGSAPGDVGTGYQQWGNYDVRTRKSNSPRVPSRFFIMGFFNLWVK